MDNYIVLECNKYGNNGLNEVSQVMTRLSYGGEWRAGKGRGRSCWNIGWLGMECIHDTNAVFILQGKSYIMGQAIERKWKQNKDKESNGATYRSVWKGQPSEVCTGLEGEMAQFEELSVAILEKKQKEEEDIEIKWPFWEDLNFLRASLQNSDEDNLVWTAEEIGNPFSYSDWIHERYACNFNTTNAQLFDFVGANATPVMQRTTYRHTYNSAQFWAPNIIFSAFLVYIES